MIKIILFSLVLFSFEAYSTEYKCDVIREIKHNGYTKTTSYTNGIIYDDNKNISYKTFDNNDKYTSGELTEEENAFEPSYGDNVLACTDILSTKKVFPNGNVYKFQNYKSGVSITFYNCKSYKLPEQNFCSIGSAANQPPPAACSVKSPLDKPKSKSWNPKKKRSKSDPEAINSPNLPSCY